MRREIANLVPCDILEILGPPALWPSEDRAAYDKMLAHAAADLRPNDTIGWMLVKPLVDDLFEILLYRRLKVEWMQSKFDAIKTEKVSALSEEMQNSPTYGKQWNIESKLEKIDQRRPGFEALNETALRKEWSELQREEDDRLAKTYVKLEEAKASSTTEGEFVTVVVASLEGYLALDRLLHAAEDQFNMTRAQLEQHYRGLGRKLRERFESIIEGEIISEGALP